MNFKQECRKVADFAKSNGCAQVSSILESLSEGNGIKIYGVACSHTDSYGETAHFLERCANFLNREDAEAFAFKLNKDSAAAFANNLMWRCSLSSFLKGEIDELNLDELEILLKRVHCDSFDESIANPSGGVDGIRKAIIKTIVNGWWELQGSDFRHAVVVVDVIK